MNALRSLARSPGYTSVAVGILALGIGASTAIFSVVNAVLLSPLPYKDPQQLVQVQSQRRNHDADSLTPATFMAVAAESRSFAAIAAQTYYYVNLTKSGPPALVTEIQATADYFRVFDVAPLLGRTWIPDETKSGHAPVVVLGQELWERQYGGNRELIGQNVIIEDVPHTVIGVMPASFKEPWGNSQLWKPMPTDDAAANDHSSRSWSTFARRKPGVSNAQANAELVTLGARLAQSLPANEREWTLGAADLRSLVVGDYQKGLLVVLGAVGCVMLITCANIAGLTVVRAATRRKELAVRVALGASRGQLVRQLLAESLTLSALGGLLGLLLASWGLAALLGSIPSGWLPRAEEISLNAPVILAAIALTLVTGVAFGLAPAFTAASVDANDALKDQARGSVSPAARRVRSSLVVVEIALASILLVSAGLLGRSLLNALQKKSGLDAPRLLSLTLLPSAKRYDTPEKRREFYVQAERQVAAVAGVEAAGFTQTSPFRWGNSLALTPVPLAGESVGTTFPSVFYDSVSADYFRSVGCTLRAGRFFSASDQPGSKPVIIVSESMARRFFGGENPVGRELTSGAAGTPSLEIVGVVADIRRVGLASETPLQAYRPLAQRPSAFATLMVRTPLAPSSLAKAVQSALWQIDPDLPVSEIAPMDQIVSRTLTQPRLYLKLFGGFALLALVLAAIGLYSLIAYSVAQRTREFGIRTALGATPAQMRSLVLREGRTLIVWGLGLGTVGAFAAARFLQQMVFETSVHDPVVFLTVPLCLGLVALAACLLPARRATRIDPIIALRSE